MKDSYLTEQVKVDQVKAATADGTSTVASSSVDMDGYDGVVFIAEIQTAAADNLIHVETSDDDSTWNDLEDSEIDLTSGSEEGQIVLEVKRPKERYLRVSIVRGTTTVLGEIYALRYGAKSVPVTNAVAGTLAIKQLLSPAEGTK